MSPYDDLVARFEGSSPELGRALTKAHEFLKGWWTEPHLGWYTDHGPDHSKRVADYALQLAACSNMSVPFTDDELFVLAAAALLHDLGMQVIISRESSLGQLGQPFDYDVVRQRHPEESLRMILEKATEIGLPDDPELVPAVALIAQSHGSNYFDSSVEKIGTHRAVRNQLFRGAALCAILLFADELDLHYERARFPNEDQITLSATSRAHNYKHLYVSSVDLLLARPGSAKVRVDMRFPPSLELNDCQEIKRWILVKLRQQVGRVQPTLSKSTDHQLQIDRRIEVSHAFEDPAYRDTIDETAMKIIRMEVARDRIINYQREIEGLAEAAETARTIGVASNLEDGVQSRDDILNWLGRRLGDFRVVESWKVQNKQGGSPSDVLTDWLEGIGLQPATEGNESVLREDLLEQLATALERSPRTCLVCRSIDLLAGRDQAWMIDNCFSRLLTLESVKIAFSASSNSSFPSGPKVFLVKLGSPDAIEVSKHFKQFQDDPLGEIYLGAGLRYDALRALADQHELQLAGGGE